MANTAVAAILAGILASRLQDVPQGTQQGLVELDAACADGTALLRCCLMGFKQGLSEIPAKTGPVIGAARVGGRRQDTKGPAPNVGWMWI